MNFAEILGHLSVIEMIVAGLLGVLFAVYVGICFLEPAGFRSAFWNGVKLLGLLAGFVGCCVVDIGWLFGTYLPHATHVWLIVAEILVVIAKWVFASTYLLLFLWRTLVRKS